MAVRTSRAERAIDALRVLRIGDLSAREHVQTLVAAVAGATEPELIHIVRLLDALDVDAPRVARRFDDVAAAADPVERSAALAKLRDALAVSGWHRDPAASAAPREPLLRLAARYLLVAKRADGAPLDAVERFYLASGAIAERLDRLAT